MINIIFQSVLYSIPLAIAAVGALICDNVGIINIGLEGFILFGGCLSYVITRYSNNLFLGVFFSLIISAFFSLFFSYFLKKMGSITLGFAINIIFLSITNIIMYFKKEKFIKNVFPSFLNLPVPTYIIIVLISFVHYLMNYTKLGLRIRSVGINEKIARKISIDVDFYQKTIFIISNIFACVAGIYLSMGKLGLFVKNMSAGRGFIALALMNLGNKNPFYILFLSLIMGFLNSFQLDFNSDSQIMSIFPYLFIIIFAIFKNLLFLNIFKEKFRRIY